ncbi:hypothetical protein BBP40_003801 [Aspergillus hancockii]|nr:hypothetical protein BBP40_003801 [Aspergillus hancockii]
MSRIDEFAGHPFDYLIIGGGTAGLVLAARLSERPGLTIGVIEAGPAALEEKAINIPGLYGSTIGSTKYDWQFETSPQLGLAGRTLSWPRGRVLGGTSALNFMAWNRGNREDYDAWAELGNQGWGWDDLLPFFHRSETFYPPERAHQDQHYSYYRADAHGTSGPLRTTHIQKYGPAHRFWHATLNKVGIETSPDSLDGSNRGAWNMICTVDPVSQTRSYSANAYYLPASTRPNLVVLTEAMATEVLIGQNADGGWVAKGVEIVCAGEYRKVHAAKEVILSAGSVQSPQLLELSGIGPREVLESAGIPVKIENPNVGENLQEHMMTATIFEVPSDIATRDEVLRDPILREAADQEYESSQTGPWTILPCSIAYCPLSQIIPPDELADLRSRAESIAKHTGQRRDEILARQFRDNANLGQIEYLFDVGNWSPYFPSEDGKKYGTMLQMLQYPFSRGSIHLPSQEPGTRATIHNKPVIDPRYYLGVGEIDLTIMKLGQRLTNRICTTKPLSEIICSRVFPPPPDPAETDEYDDFVRNYTITDWHPIGTCAMGGSEAEKAGVVDERLRVYGVRGLRVVDASVMPLQISAHIQATVYAIAEKAAAMILEDAA